MSKVYSPITGIERGNNVFSESSCLVDFGSKGGQEITREEAAMGQTSHLVFIHTEALKEVFCARK